MFKTILVFCAVLAAAKASSGGLANYNNIYTRVNNYINMNKQQYANIIQDLDDKLENFITHYSGCVKGLDIQLKMIIETVVENEDILNPLEVLNPRAEGCVSKYRLNHLETEARQVISQAMVQASSAVDNLLLKPRNIRNYLQAEYKNLVANKIKECGTKYSYTITNYTYCITNTFSTFNKNTAELQKDFEFEYDAALCAAKANIKHAYDTVYNSQNTITSQMAQSNILINTCMEGEDECKPCPERNICTIGQRIDSRSDVIENPLYNAADGQTCAILYVE